VSLILPLQEELATKRERLPCPGVFLRPCERVAGQPEGCDGDCVFEQGEADAALDEEGYFVYVGAKKKLLLKYLNFRQKLAWQFIDNPYLPNTRAKPVSPFFTQLVDHTIQTPHPHARSYLNQKWVIDAKTKYPQFLCTVPG
jgi:hypothetical protein